MKIETEYNIGDIILYDDGKTGEITGFEISSKWGVSYNIKAVEDNRNKYIQDQVFLNNYGDLRHETELKKH